MMTRTRPRRTRRLPVRPLLWGLASCVTFGPTALIAQSDGTADMIWQQDMRVAAIGYRLERANRAICPVTELQTGLLLHDITSYDKVMRPAIEQRFGLGRNIGIRGVIPGSPADLAGLRKDDVILRAGALDTAETDPGHAAAASADRTRRFEQALALQLASGPQAVTVRRDHVTMTMSLRGETVCAGTYSVHPAASFDAWSDGRNVAVNSGVLATLDRPDDLAFVLAHEMGHNWIEQAGRARHQLPRDNWLLRISAEPVNGETKADLVAETIMQHAGYDLDAGIRVLSAQAISDEPRQKARRSQLRRRILALRNYKPLPDKETSR